MSYIVFIGAIFSIDLFLFHHYISDSDYAVKMNLSYEALPFILADVYYVLHKHVRVIERTVATFSLIIFMIPLSNWASRGVLLSLFLYPIAIFYNSSSKGLRTLLAFLLIVLSYIVYIYPSIVIEGISRLFNRLGYNLFALERTKSLIQAGNVLSGRDILVAQAINELKITPIISINISRFEIQTNNYAHNFIIQMLLDYGWLTGIVMIGILLISLHFTLSNRSRKLNNDIRLYSLANFIPSLMFSSTYWLNRYFWLYIYLWLEGDESENTY